MSAFRSASSQIHGLDSPQRGAFPAETSKSAPKPAIPATSADSSSSRPQAVADAISSHDPQTLAAHPHGKPSAAAYAKMEKLVKELLVMVKENFPHLSPSSSAAGSSSQSTPPANAEPSRQASYGGHAAGNLAGRRYAAYPAYQAQAHPYYVAPTTSRGEANTEPSRKEDSKDEPVRPAYVAPSAYAYAPYPIYAQPYLPALPTYGGGGVGSFLGGAMAGLGAVELFDGVASGNPFEAISGGLMMSMGAGALGGYGRRYGGGFGCGPMMCSALGGLAGIGLAEMLMF